MLTGVSMYLYEFVLVLVNLAAAILWALGKGRGGHNRSPVLFSIMIASFLAIMISVAVNGSLVQRCPPAGSGLQKVHGVYC